MTVISGRQLRLMSEMSVFLKKWTKTQTMNLTYSKRLTAFILSEETEAEE